MKVKSQVPKRFPYSSFAFHDKCWPVPPPCILCRNLWRLEVLFRGMFGGKGAGRRVHVEKAKSECKIQRVGCFSARNRMYDSHTSSADNRPSSDKFPVLSLAPDLPHTLYYCHFIFPPRIYQPLYQCLLLICLTGGQGSRKKIFLQ